MATPEIDTDYDWLKSHLQLTGKLQGRANLARQVADELTGRIERRQLPYTLGVFGGWGTGKTTLLAMIADQLESSGTCRLVYFNSWKYAGFMEIVPALIYKIMQYGLAGEKRQQDEAAMRILLALGKKYSDQIGDWAQTKIGINPSELFKDVFAVAKKKMAGVPPAAPDVVRAYYTQVDKAQDALRDALGSV